MGKYGLNIEDYIDRHRWKNALQNKNNNVLDNS